MQKKAAPAGAWEGSVAPTRSRCPRWEGVSTCAVGRFKCQLLRAAALGAAHSCGVTLTIGAIALACLRYDRLTPVARVAGPRCFAGDTSWAVCGHACHRLMPWHRMTFAMVPGSAQPRSHQWPWSTAPATSPPGRLGRPSSSDPWGVVFCALPLCHPRCVCACGVRRLLALVHRCARPVCAACAVCGRLTLVHRWARCVRHACALVCLLVAPRSACGVMGHLAPVQRRACSVCCVACAPSWFSWLMLTGLHARCAVLRVRCPGPLGSCSRCARSVCCAVCAVSWATWLLFTGVHARCVVLRVRCPWPLCSCSPVCTLGVLCCACGVLRHLAPVHRCARFVCCVACAVSWTN